MQFYEEDDELALKIGDEPGAAVTAFNLGHAYKNLPPLRDLDQAERGYPRGLELLPRDDLLQRGKGSGSLGSVAYARFKEARGAQQPEAELLRHLHDALRAYYQALDLLPATAVNDLAVAHNQLGIIYRNADDLDRALPHYREAIRYFEAAGDLYPAAVTRRNVAVALVQTGRLADARAYAEAALRNYETFGDRAAAEIEETRGLVAAIEEVMAAGAG